MNCRLCNAPLSRYHDARSDLCRLCETSLRPLDQEALTLLVEGILLEELAIHGRAARAVDLRHELERRGIRSTGSERHAAVCRARERRIVLDVESDGPHSGYRCIGAEQVFIPRGTVGNRHRPVAEQLRMA